MKEGSVAAGAAAVIVGLFVFFHSYYGAFMKSGAGSIEELYMGLFISSGIVVAIVFEF